MSIELTSRPVARCLRCASSRTIVLPLRTFTTSAPLCEEQLQQAHTKSEYNPFNVQSAKQERRLMREQRKVPIGSRRRRIASQRSAGLPFSQLPYQCFQEARMFLQADRAEKVAEIDAQRVKLERLQDTVPVEDKAIIRKNIRVKSMQDRIEELKIFADINDPLVKKRFEDGQGDMSKPIYRHLAEKKWNAQARPLLMQRITQMNVVPDVLPKIEPTVSTSLSFVTRPGRRQNVQHGDFVLSTLSENAPNLKIQPFEKGDKLVTIAVINPDIPNVSTDSFDSRIHFLACNIPISPTNTLVKLGELKEDQVVIPWLPAYAQKGAPYQRMSIIILEQPSVSSSAANSDSAAAPKSLDVASLISSGINQDARDTFKLRSFVPKHALKPIGVDLFRTQWDEGTAGVMRRAGIIGANVEFKRKKIEPLPYKRLKGERYR